MRYAIVLSYPRTGSTVIQSLLNTVDGYCVRGEYMGAITSLTDFIDVIRLSTTDVKDVVGGNTLSPSSPLFGISEIKDSEVVDSLRKFYVNVILKPPPLTQVVGWKENFISPITNGEKHANTMLGVLTDLFPNAKYIINIRNPDDVSRSAVWKQSVTAREDIERCRNWLVGVHESGYLGADSSILLDHDEWNGNPSLLCGELNSFGIPVGIEETERVLGEQLTHLKDW